MRPILSFFLAKQGAYCPPLIVMQQRHVPKKWGDQALMI